MNEQSPLSRIEHEAKPSVLGPFYMDSDTRDNPPPETTLLSVYMKMRDRVKVDPF